MGTGLAIGYLGERSLTDAAFVHVEINGSAVRLYRTGDLGYWNEEGLLCFRGRADRQVKIRGHRIEPAEVEQQILALLPGVRQCRVLVRRDEGGAARDMLAFCVPEDESDALSRAEAVLTEGLPAYQPGRPPCSACPRCRSRRRARWMSARCSRWRTGRAGDGRERGSGPGRQGRLAGLVAETFAAVLGRDEVPADVSFFALGGT